MTRLITLFCIAVILSGCDSFNNPTSASPPAKKFHHSILQFGTIIDITLVDVPEQTAATIFNTLDQDFAYWQKSWSPWAKGSLVRVNKLLPTEAAFNISLNLIPMVRQSQQLYEQSEGLFNPAIGHLINLWEFHKADEAGKQPPDTEKIKSLVAANPGMHNLTLSEIQLQSNNENVQLNFGAFAKGFAIELSMKTLQQFGVRNAIINAGGDLKVIGQHVDRPWRIGIRHPRDKNKVIASVKALNNDSVFTSGDYERFFIHNNKRYNHILDPRSGYPADLSQSVTVIHNDAGIADAAATALFVAGPDDWPRIAKKMGIKMVMLIAANGDIHLSPAMADRIELHHDNQSSVKLSDDL